MGLESLKKPVEGRDMTGSRGRPIQGRQMLRYCERQLMNYEEAVQQHEKELEKARERVRREEEREE